jgi:hypothetical protein
MSNVIITNIQGASDEMVQIIMNAYADIYMPIVRNITIKIL